MDAKELDEAVAALWDAMGALGSLHVDGLTPEGRMAARLLVRNRLAAVRRKRLRPKTVAEQLDHQIARLRTGRHGN